MLILFSNPRGRSLPASTHADQDVPAGSLAAASCAAGCKLSESWRLLTGSIAAGQAHRADYRATGQLKGPPLADCCAVAGPVQAFQRAGLAPWAPEACAALLAASRLQQLLAGQTLQLTWLGLQPYQAGPCTCTGR